MHWKTFTFGAEERNYARLVRSAPFGGLVVFFEFFLAGGLLRKW